MIFPQIRAKSPLIHNITNIVVANFQANGLLALGASPVMADAVEEMAEMTSIVSALSLNIGTLNSTTLEAMLTAGKVANNLNLPIVLDPVGVGATSFRHNVIKSILQELQISLIRCNLGELATIAGVEWQQKGVDSGDGELDIESVAKAVATKYKCIVAVTGERDFVTDGIRGAWVTGGSSLMPHVTGSGCLLSAICAAGLTIDGDKLDNTIKVLQEYKMVAEQAAVGNQYLGDFQVGVLNALHKLSL